MTGWFSNSSLTAFRQTGDPARLLIVWERFYSSLLGYNPLAECRQPLPRACRLQLAAGRPAVRRYWTLSAVRADSTGGCACSGSGSGAPRSALSMLSDVTPAGHRILSGVRAGGPSRLRSHSTEYWPAGLARPYGCAGPPPAVAAVALGRPRWSTRPPTTSPTSATATLDWYGNQMVRYVPWRGRPASHVVVRARTVAGRHAASLAREPLPVGQRPLLPRDRRRPRPPGRPAARPGSSVRLGDELPRSRPALSTGSTCFRSVYPVRARDAPRLGRPAAARGPARLGSPTRSRPQAGRPARPLAAARPYGGRRRPAT